MVDEVSTNCAAVITSVTPRFASYVAPVVPPRQPRARDRSPRAIPDEPPEPLSVVAVDPGVRVKRQPQRHRPPDASGQPSRTARCSADCSGLLLRYSVPPPPIDLELRASDTADVYIDGRKVGGSPVLGHRVKAGKHKVRFDCYDAAGEAQQGVVQTVDVAVEGERDVEYECPRSRGDLCPQVCVRSCIEEDNVVGFRHVPLGSLESSPGRGPRRLRWTPGRQLSAHRGQMRAGQELRRDHQGLRDAAQLPDQRRLREPLPLWGRPEVFGHLSERHRG